MNFRHVITGLALVVAAIGIFGVHAQRERLRALRAEAAAREATQASAPAEAQHAPAPIPKESDLTAELLQLRSEATRLQARQRELAGVPAAAERLRAQLASAGTNSAGGVRLPAGYLRASTAQLVGYGTPENTLQSVLWAIRNHDVTNLLQALTPEAAQRLQATISSRTPEVFFGDADKLPGFEIRNQQTLPDGSVELEVGVVPSDAGQKVRFQSIGGQWKFDGPF